MVQRKVLPMRGMRGVKRSFEWVFAGRDRGERVVGL